MLVVSSTSDRDSFSLSAAVAVYSYCCLPFSDSLPSRVYSSSLFEAKFSSKLHLACVKALELPSARVSKP